VTGSITYLPLPVEVGGGEVGGGGGGGVFFLFVCVSVVDLGIVDSFLGYIENAFSITAASIITA
jgi:hypothetical protein